jgi:hypothetical protein
MEMMNKTILMKVSFLINRKESTVFQMLDMLVGRFYFSNSPLNQFPHIVFSIQNFPSLLILVDINLNLLNKLS